ncbi:hypothetical protein CC78DRAFT_586264 [Lojkania enalia]|uniref:Uncharacterized protein n=1 Tax=Lojkania enalia TaxID=147567 RepID=A0A9P4MZ37_9PLEO|nr:hypothetical protein CC78DRAFT_586264 [Didymosphaeria enalia]
MSNSGTTIGNPPILYLNTNTSQEADLEGSLEAVDTTAQATLERKDNESRGEMNAEKTSTKYPNARERPSPYGLLGKGFRSALETWLTLLGAIEIAALVIHLGRKLGILEEHDRYIMSHLGELDDRFDDLRIECNESRDTIRRLQDEIHRLKGGSNEIEADEGVRKVGNRVQKRRKRARGA